MAPLSWWGCTAALYVWIYTALIVIGAVVSLDAVIGLIDGMYAVMAIPTMISALCLAPKVRAATKDYFRHHAEEPHAVWEE